MKWPIIEIDIDGQTRGAIAPFVISASRATDIPAFHGKWLVERLKKGYCKWVNPFNRNLNSLISFEKCKVIVFWTKNPIHFFKHLDYIDTLNKQYYFQYTLNDYTIENLEPRLPQLNQRIKAFKDLSQRIGKNRIIWRFDPIILSTSISIDSILQRIKFIGNSIAPYTNKLVFSFVDMYKRTENRLKKIDLSLRAPAQEEMIEFAENIVKLNNQWDNKLELATCAEKINLSHFGIKKNKCVDDELILSLCENDVEINNLYGKQDNITQQFSLLTKYENVLIKDSGQRTPCGCVPSKDIGAYNTCMHLCEYCYANSSIKTVISNMNMLSIDSPSLI